jgi:serine/threonine-protein kinase HipA
LSVRAIDDLRRVDAADVHKGGTLAGTLRREDGTTVFRYEQAYLDDMSTPAVSYVLRKSPDRITTAGEAVPPFFAGLLPEGIRLRAIVTGARTSEDDHLTLLLAVGQDTIGDVQVVEAGTEPTTPQPQVDTRRIHQDVDLAEVFRQVTAPSTDLGRIALPGVQVKVSAAMISTPLATTTGPAILKLNPPREFPRLVENEHFFLRMADACGLPTPGHALVHDRTGNAGLLVERFDRVVTDGNVRRLAQEDACQLLGAYPAAKYRLKTETVTSVIADTVRAGDGSPPLAVRRVLELVAFSYLIGNGDLHGKNFSVRQSPGGSWEVTPVYDLVSTQPYLSWQDPMALDLFGRANKLDRAHLVWAFERLGLPRRASERTLDRICEAAPPWIERVGEIGFDTATTARLAAYVTAKLSELQGDRRS